MNQYRPFHEAREYVHKLGLKGRSEWEQYCKSGNKPDNIPSNPQKKYRIVDETMEKLNSREHKLFVKKNNPLVLVTSELEEFEKAYMQLLNKLKEKSKKVDFSEIASQLGIKEINPSKWSESEVSRYLQSGDEKVKELENKKRTVTLRVDKIESKVKEAKLTSYRTASLNSANVNESIRNELLSVKSEIALLEEEVQNRRFIPSTRGPILIFKNTHLRLLMSQHSHMATNN